VISTIRKLMYGLTEHLFTNFLLVIIHFK